MVEDGGKKAGGVAETEERELVGGKALDDVVDRNVGGPADEDPEVARDKLVD